MKNLILATVSAVALLGVAACSDSGTDNSTTQSTNPPAAEQPMTPTTPDTTTSPQATPPATGGSTMQGTTPVEPAPAPAQ